MQKGIDPAAPRPIAAAGTLHRPADIERPGLARRCRLIIEIGAIFIFAPVLMMHVIYSWRVPVWAALAPVLIGLAAYLLADRTFSLKREFAVGFGRREAMSILALFLIGGGVVTAYVAEFMPERFLSLPRERPHVWSRVLIAYPFLSVLVQEFVYRTYFFHRYGPLFGTSRWAMIVASGVAFGFAHIIFKNWVAVVGTTLTGLLFAWRYERTRSLAAVWVEHTLWGWMVFTVGLGGFFFTGVVTGWKLPKLPLPW
jgi:membrane protease YdiL (CAAX protease family)